MATQQIVLEIDSKGSAKLVKDAKKVKKSWLETSANLTISFQGLKAVMGKLSSAFSYVVDDAIKFQKTSANLNATLSGQGLNVEKTRKGMDAFAKTTSLATGVSQDLILEQISLYSTMSGGIKNYDKATKAAIGLANATGIDLNAAMRNIAKTTGGYAGELGEIIPELKNFTQEQLQAGKGVEYLSEAFAANLTGAVNTTVGSFERLNTIWGDFYVEQVGLAITQNDVFTAGLSTLGTELANLAPSFDDLRDLLTDVVMWMLKATDTLLGLGQTVATFFADLVRWTGEFNSMIHTAVLAPIKAVIVAAIELSKFLGLSDKTVMTLQATEQLLTELGSATERAGHKVADVIDSSVKGMATAQGVVGKVIESMENVDNGAVKVGKSIGKNVIKPIKKASKDIIEMTKAIDSYLDNLHWDFDKFGDEYIKSIEDFAIRAEEKLAARNVARGMQPSMRNQGGWGAVEKKVGEGIGIATEGPTSAIGKLGSAALSEGLGLIGALIDLMIEGFKDPESIDRMLELIETMISNLLNPDAIERVLNGVVNMFIMIVDLIATPGFLSSIVEAVVKALVQMVMYLIPQLPAIGLEIIKAIIVGIWTAIKEFGKGLLKFFKRLIVKIVTLGLGGGETHEESVAGTFRKNVEAAEKGGTQLYTPSGQTGPTITQTTTPTSGGGASSANTIFATPDETGPIAESTVSPGQGGGLSGNVTFEQGSGQTKEEWLKYFSEIIAQYGWDEKNKAYKGYPPWHNNYSNVYRSLTGVMMGAEQTGVPIPRYFLDQINYIRDNHLYHEPGSLMYLGRPLKSGIDARDSLKKPKGYLDGGTVGSPEIIEAHVGEEIIPIYPRSNKGLTTDGRGNVRQVRGGSSGINISVSINAIDTKGFEAFMRSKGTKVLIDAIKKGMADSQGRSFKHAIRTV